MSNTKTNQVILEVENVKTVAMNNLIKLNESMYSLEKIESQSEELKNNSHSFSKSSKKHKRKIWWNNVKTKVLLVGIIVVGVIIFGLVVGFLFI